MLLFLRWMMLMLIIALCSTTVRAAGRIVGGDVVESNSTYPYFAIVKTKRIDEDGKVSFGQCGGTLISPTAVLTAAHCVINPTIVSIEVELGAITDNDMYSQKVDVISGEINPSFKQSNGEGDLAVLRLLKQVDITPANVTFFGDLRFPDTFDNVTIIGFGFNETASGISDVLREVTIDVRAPGDCGAFNLTMGDKKEKQFCAGGDGETPCSGDSGGPALFQGDIVAGITSFGSGCDSEPAIFTRVSNYETFIREAVCTGIGQASWCEGEEPEPKDPPDPAPSFCYHGSNLVNVLDERVVVRMQDLELGDMVHVGDGVYEPIYTFGHRAPSTDATFLQIKTQHSKLRLTPDHMLFTPDRGAVPASLLQVGEHLVDAAGVLDRIEAIKSVKDRGLYAPFTPSGRIVVNSILASSYAALEESEGLDLFGVTLSHQWLYHAVQFPHRVVCYHLGRCQSEKYSDEGISLWLYQPMKLAEWLLSQNTSLRFLWMLPLSLIAVVLSVVETLVLHPVLSVVLLLATALIRSRRRLKFKQA